MATQTTISLELNENGNVFVFFFVDEQNTEKICLRKIINQKITTKKKTATTAEMFFGYFIFTL